MTRTTSLYETCQDLFGQYPLAVRNVNHTGTVRSMVLMLEDDGEPAFFILNHQSKDADDFYSLWRWPGEDIAEIEPDTELPATGEVADILTQGVPLPRNGSFFGWKTGGVVTTTMTVYADYCPERPIPGWAVAPLEGVPDSSWPPFTGETLAEGWSWDGYRNGDIVDLAPLIAATPGTVFWAYPDGLTYPCCAVARNVTSPDGWVLVQGCYVGWRSLRDEETAGPLDEVLAGDVTDLAPRFQER